MMAETTLPVLTDCCADGLTSPLSRSDAEVWRALKAVADPARLQLLALIRSAGETCACDLYEPVGLSQPTVSHHLKGSWPTRVWSIGSNAASGRGSA